ncbi:FeoA family protein [Flaviflexus sp.]|uniref:FeoA family protein n=1 Tax=Flaviflexus sp. TaxID=1969482 RepID=UPI003F921116
MNLSAWPRGRTARLVSTDFPTGSLRAKELGLRPGAIVRVTQRTLFGGTVLDVSGSRLALDRTSVRRMIVEPLDVEGAPS